MKLSQSVYDALRTNYSMYIVGRTHTRERDTDFDPEEFGLYDYCLVPTDPLSDRPLLGLDKYGRRGFVVMIERLRESYQTSRFLSFLDREWCIVEPDEPTYKAMLEQVATAITYPLRPTYYNDRKARQKENV